MNEENDDLEYVSVEELLSADADNVFFYTDDEEDDTDEEIFPVEGALDVRRATAEEAAKLKAWQQAGWRKYIRSET